MATTPVIHDSLTPCSKAEPCPQCRPFDLFFLPTIIDCCNIPDQRRWGVFTPEGQRFVPWRLNKENR